MKKEHFQSAKSTEGAFRSVFELPKGSMEVNMKVDLNYSTMYGLENRNKFSDIIEGILKENGSENPKLELQIIDEIINENSEKAINESIAVYIKEKKPIQYLSGYTYINKTKLFINQNVLLPGPEMDFMLSVCKQYIKDRFKVMDLCCGSGVISTMLALEYPNAHFYASDISEGALELAQKNFDYYNLSNVIKYQGDLYEPFIDMEIFEFDVLIANPPYCRTEDIKDLPIVVKNYAPRIAIDGGKDGLELHRRVIKDAARFLKQDGIIVLQNENGQSKEVQKLLNESGFEITEVIRNHRDEERIVAARLVKR